MLKNQAAFPKKWRLLPAGIRLANFFLPAALILVTGCQHRAKNDADKWTSHVPPNERPLVLIDAGHGGKDEGAVNRRLRLYEKHLCLKTAKLVEQRLKQMGYATLMIRSRDEYISLDKRVSLANHHPQSIFISVHFNSAKNLKAEGIETFYYDEPNPAKRHIQSRKLSESILKSAISYTGAPSRGAKPAGFRVIRQTIMPACLVEGGFITNRNEAKKLSQSSYLHQLADGIVQGIDNYCRENAKLASKPNPHLQKTASKNEL